MSSIDLPSGASASWYPLNGLIVGRTHGCQQVDVVHRVDRYGLAADRGREHRGKVSVGPERRHRHLGGLREGDRRHARERLLRHLPQSRSDVRIGRQPLVVVPLELEDLAHRIGEDHPRAPGFIRDAQQPGLTANGDVLDAAGEVGEVLPPGPRGSQGRGPRGAEASEPKLPGGDHVQDLPLMPVSTSSIPKAWLAVSSVISAQKAPGTGVSASWATAGVGAAAASESKEMAASRIARAVPGRIVTSLGVAGRRRGRAIMPRVPPSVYDRDPTLPQRSDGLAATASPGCESMRM